MDSLELDIPLDAYSREIVESAIYRNSASLTFRVISVGKETLKVSISPTQDQKITSKELEHAFYTCLNEESLKNKVFTKTNQLRELILAHAFHKANFDE